MKMIDKVSDQLRTQNFTNGQIAAVTEAIIDNFPSRVYVIAVWFIGIITSLLTIGALLLLAEGKTAEGL